MKRPLALLLASTLLLILAGCSNKTTDIDGTITGYVQVEEYAKPLIVIEGNGKTFYLALVGADVIATDVDYIDETLRDEILNGDITEINVHVDDAEKGKTLEIDGKKITVCQSHQIQKLEQ